MKSIYEKPIVRNLDEGLPISLGQDGCQTGSVPGPNCNTGISALGGCTNGNWNQSGLGCIEGNNNAGGPEYACQNGNNNSGGSCLIGNNVT